MRKRVFLCLLAAMVAFASPGWATTYHVTPGGEGEASLSGAVDAACLDNTATAEAPHVIIAADGTYEIDMTLYLSNHITLRAADGAHPTLEYKGENSGNAVISGGNGYNASISGFTLTNAKGPGMGIYNEGTATVTNCTFAGNTGNFGSGGGLNVSGNATVTVANCVFANNTAERFGGGIYIQGQNIAVTVLNSTFAGNTAQEGGGGMYVDDGAAVAVANCTFTGNAATGDQGSGGGIDIQNNAAVTVTNCTFASNTAPYGAEIFMAGFHNGTDELIPTLNAVNTVFWHEGSGYITLVRESVSQKYPVLNLYNCVYSKDAVTGVEWENDEVTYKKAEAAPEFTKQDCFGELNWTGRLSEDVEGAEGVKHTVFRLAANDKEHLINKGLNVTAMPLTLPNDVKSALTKDQLGKTRAGAPDIGAVESVAVTKVTLDKSEASIDLNGTLTLKVTVLPEDATIPDVIWSSGSEDIATVDQNGRVTGKSVGMATVTVKSSEDETQSAVCKVTVGSAANPDDTGKTDDSDKSGPDTPGSDKGSDTRLQPVDITPQKKEQVRLILKENVERMDLPSGVDPSTVEVLPLSGDTVKMGGTRNTSSLSENEKSVVTGENKVPAAVLPEITASQTGVFCFTVSLDINVSEDATLEWHPFPKTGAEGGSAVDVAVRLAADGDGDRTAIFMKNGTAITTVPADHEVEVAAYLEANVTYAPVIAAVTSSDSSGPTSNKGSGGCDAGLGAAGLLACLAFLVKRR